MNKSINDLEAENVLATQSQDEQKQPESASENEVRCSTKCCKYIL